MFADEGVAAAVVSCSEARARAFRPQPAHEGRVPLREVCTGQDSLAVDVVDEQLVGLHQQQDAAVGNPSHFQYPVTCRHGTVRCAWSTVRPVRAAALRAHTRNGRTV